MEEIPLSSLSDSEVLKRHDEGDEFAFAEITYRYEKILEQILKNRCYIYEDDVPDVLQETWLQLFISLKRKQYDYSKPFTPWLFQIARNKATDFKRNRRKRPAKAFSQFGRDGDSSYAVDLFDDITGDEKLSSLAPSRRFEGSDDGASRNYKWSQRAYNIIEPSGNLQQAEYKLIIWSIMSAMPKDLKAVFLSRHYKNLTYREIARELHISRGTVEYRLKKAEAFLVEKWNEEQNSIK